MDIWKHGKYVDLWSLVHFLSGGILASAFYGLGFSLVVATIFSIIILAAWEVLEWLTGIIEPSANVAVDLVVGLGGFGGGAFFYYSGMWAFNTTNFALLLGVTGLLGLWGFLDYLRRGYR